MIEKCVGCPYNKDGWCLYYEKAIEDADPFVMYGKVIKERECLKN